MVVILARVVILQWNQTNQEARIMVKSKATSKTLRFDPKLWAKLQKMAEREGRSLSNYLERVLEKHAETPRVGHAG